KAWPAERAALVFSEARIVGVRRARRACRADGARTRCRTRLADQRGDARSPCPFPVTAWTARHSNWNSYFLFKWWFLGRLDRRLGFHLSELCDRRCFGCSLRLFR